MTTSQQCPVPQPKNFLAFPNKGGAKKFFGSAKKFLSPRWGDRTRDIPEEIAQEVRKEAQEDREKGIEGVHRFLKKVHRECLQTDKHLQDQENNKETLKVLHETILKVTEAIEDLRFNVAISQMMILVNQLQKVDSYSLDTIKTLLQLLAPFAPHLAEELWESLGEKPSIVNEPWPQARKELLVSDEITIVFQVNGKLRGEGQFPKDVDKDSVTSAAKADAKVQTFLEGKEIVKEIYVPGKLVNLAAKG